jgi:hypothetical protein
VGVGPCVSTDVVERPEDALPVVDSERDDGGPEAERLLEQTPRRLVDESGELPNVVVGNSEAGENHVDAVFDAAATASEQGLLSGPGVGPDLRRCSPLLESCIGLCATRRGKRAKRTRRLGLDEPVAHPPSCSATSTPRSSASAAGGSSSTRKMPRYRQPRGR